MKKSLVMMVVLVSSLALAGTVMANYDWACYEMPVCKPVCNDTVLCKGEAKGKINLCGGPCGPCAPAITYAGRWLTVVRCPAPPAPPAVVPEASIMPPDFKTLTVGCCAVAVKPAAAAKSPAAKKAKGDKAAKPAKDKKK